MPRKRLEDLYVRGKEVTFEDGDLNVTVWVQRLNRIDHRNAVRRADAARARVLAIRAEPDSDEYMAIRGQVLDTDPSVLIAKITADDERKVRMSAEARLAAEDEWSKDNYLEGLRDAWAGGLMYSYAENPEDPEAKRVFGELKRFTEAVNAQTDPDVEALRARYEGVPEPELWDEATEVYIRQAADEAWLDEFVASEAWLATREATDHHKRYYANRHELDELHELVFNRLTAAVDDLRVDPMEGKDSEGTPTSSASSAPPEPEATEVSSGPVAVGV